MLVGKLPQWTKEMRIQNTHYRVNINQFIFDRRTCDYKHMLRIQPFYGGGSFGFEILNPLGFIQYQEVKSGFIYCPRIPEYGFII